jgi:hypothetical protein
VIAKDAYDRGARTFGIVYEKSTHFGVEAAAALGEAASRLGANIAASMGIDLYHQTYANEISQFNASCGCDAVILALMPFDLVTWLWGGGSHGDVVTAAPQPPLGTSSAASCSDPCAGLEYWTSFRPPLGEPLTGPDRYAEVVLWGNPTVDLYNGYVEGAYAEALFLAQQIGRAGKNLTRARLQRMLDSATFDEGISVPLTWAKSAHAANLASRSYEPLYVSRSFAGFRGDSDWIADPWPGG